MPDAGFCSANFGVGAGQREVVSPDSINSGKVHGARVTSAADRRIEDVC
jgi:hypothetical protein